jgi:hypothetical protein
MCNSASTPLTNLKTIPALPPERILSGASWTRVGGLSIPPRRRLSSRYCPPRYVSRFAPDWAAVNAQVRTAFTQRAVVWNRHVRPQQLHDRPTKAFGLAIRHLENNLQCQQPLNRPIRLFHLPAALTRTFRCGLPAFNHVFADPYGERTAFHQARVVRRPVANPVGRFLCAFVLSFFLGHAHSVALAYSFNNALMRYEKGPWARTPKKPRNRFDFHLSRVATVGVTDAIESRSMLAGHLSIPAKYRLTLSVCGHS